MMSEALSDFSRVSARYDEESVRVKPASSDSPKVERYRKLMTAADFDDADAWARNKVFLLRKLILAEARESRPDATITCD